MMKCKKCGYQLFPYSQCCPMCGRKVDKKADTKSVQAPQTRLDFWLAGLKKTGKTTRVRRPLPT